MSNKKDFQWLGVFAIACFFAWLTHIFWSLHGLFTGQMTELSQITVAVLGAFLPPIGVLHGFYLWFT